MNNYEEAWQQFLATHEDFEHEFADDLPDENTMPEKQYGLTLFNGEPNGYFMVFNTQIDIFQFVRLLRYFFGIKGIDIGHVGGDGSHFHTMNDDDDDDN